MTSDDLSMVKMGKFHISSISIRVKGYFICNPSNRDTFVTKMMIPRFFIHYFYMMTSDDLPEVKLGHGQMSSVSDFVHGYRFFNPYKFHAKMIITRFFSVLLLYGDL